MKNVFTTSNKLLLGLLITILLFVTVLLSVARFNRVESKFYLEQKKIEQGNIPPVPPAPPAVPEPVQ